MQVSLLTYRYCFFSHLHYFNFYYHLMSKTIVICISVILKSVVSYFFHFQSLHSEKSNYNLRRTLMYALREHPFLKKYPFRSSIYIISSCELKLHVSVDSWWVLKKQALGRVADPPAHFSLVTNQHSPTQRIINLPPRWKREGFFGGKKANPRVSMFFNRAECRLSTRFGRTFVRLADGRPGSS